MCKTSTDLQATMAWSETVTSCYGGEGFWPSPFHAALQKDSESFSSSPLDFETCLPSRMLAFFGTRRPVFDKQWKDCLCNITAEIALV